jgi:hypothetical protein
VRELSKIESILHFEGFPLPASFVIESYKKLTGGQKSAAA